MKSHNFSHDPFGTHAFGGFFSDTQFCPRKILSEDIRDISTSSEKVRPHVSRLPTLSANDVHRDFHL